MKKILFAICITTLCGCADFLEEKMTMSLGSENMYRSLSDYEGSLIGVYDYLSPRNSPTLGGITNAYMNYNGYLLLLNELGTDEMYCVATGGVRNNLFLEELDKYVVPTTNSIVTAVYAGQYALINRANDLLAALEKQGSSATVYLQIEGQARFLRALGYYNLVTLFGGVPLTLRPGSEYLDNAAPRASVEDIYELIISDLKFGWANLPRYYSADGTATNAHYGRATGLSAGALLARTYLTAASMARHAVITPEMELEGGINSFRWVDQTDYYTQAQYYADEVISICGGGEAFTAMPYEQSFYKYENTPDVLFDVQFASGLAQIEGGWVGHITGPGSWNWVSVGRNMAFGMKPSGDKSTLYSELFPVPATRDNCDMRKAKTVSSWGLNAGSTWPPAGTGNWTQSTNPNNQIFNLGKFPLDAAPRPYPNQQSPINYTILRLGEMFLISAEAENELNGAPTPKAYDMINFVRRRAASEAILPDYDDASIWLDDQHNRIPTIVYEGNDTYSRFRFVLLQERKWELCGECVRRTDLVRSGWMKQILEHCNTEEGDAIYRQRAFDDHDIFYPIPSREVSLSNNTLIQNYGY